MKHLMKILSLLGGFALLVFGYGLIMSQTTNSVSVSIAGSLMGFVLGAMLFTIGIILVVLGVFRL